MKHQTSYPNRIPSSKPFQEGKKDTRNLLSQILVVILVVTFTFAVFLTVSSLREAIWHRLAGNPRGFPVVYDATAARNAAIVLPSQDARLAVKSSYYDATTARNAAIVLPGQADRSSVKRSYYDATAARNSAIALPGQADRSSVKRSYYDATAARNSAIVLPGQVTRPAGTGSYYDATAAMQNAIVYP